MKLNRKGFENAQKLIRQGEMVIDDLDLWSEHQPTTKEENEYIKEKGFEEYSKWFLGIDEDEAEYTKGKYKFPYGDFDSLHRCGVIAAEIKAGQYKYRDIESAAAHLHGMLATEVKEGAAYG